MLKGDLVAAFPLIAFSRAVRKSSLVMRAGIAASLQEFGERWILYTCLAINARRGRYESDRAFAPHETRRRPDSRADPRRRIRARCAPRRGTPLGRSRRFAHAGAGSAARARGRG